MRDFIVAEWKTLLAVIIFCGGIFAWFYHDELQNAAQEQKDEYQMTCLHPGQSVMDYAIGTPSSQYDLSRFERSNDDTFGISTYTRDDGAVTLTFRDDKLVSAEILVGAGVLPIDCLNDYHHYKTTEQPEAESISYGDTTDAIYKGLVVVTQNPDENDDKLKSKSDVPLSIIVVPI